jgi:phospholipase A-2-activating protein
MIREIALIKDFGFITCSNDETIKIWTLDGEMIQTLLGHKGFIFSVIAPEFGKYISGSDDKTIKLWDSGAELSTLEVGATVWAVAFNHLN